MDTMLNYSVLMTVYRKDSPEFFLQSVNSMLNQTRQTNDFVLVCDGELTEQLEECIQVAFRGHEDVLRLVRLPKNMGLGQALHDGLPLCKNEWVARMDDDDISHPDRCEIQLNYIEEHPELTILGSYVNEFEDDPEQPIRVKTVPETQEGILKFSRRRNPFNHSSVMIKRDDILAAGNYSTMRTNQDVDTWVRVLNKGYKAANIDRALVDFRFDKKTYERRKDWKNIKLMLEVWSDFRRNGYCSFADYLYVCIVQIAIYCMPAKALQWAYDHLR